MDPLSITGTAVTLTATVIRVAHEVDQFARQVREARRELGDLARELTSLKSATEMLSEDLRSPNATAPNGLQDILVECDGVVVKLEENLQRYDKERLSTRIRYVWSGKETIQTYKSTLSAHRAALDLAVDIMTLSLSREIKNDVKDVKEGVDATRDTAEEIKADTERILNEIAALQARLPAEMRQRNKVFDQSTPFMLQKYLEELTEYAETVVGYGESDVVVESSSVASRSSLTVDDAKSDRAGSTESLPTSASNVPEDELAIREQHPQLRQRSPQDTNNTEDADQGNRLLTVENQESQLESTSMKEYVAPSPSSIQEGFLKGFTVDFGIPLEYAQAGLERKAERKWREEMQLAMASVTPDEIGPNTGNIDFDKVTFDSNDYGHDSMGITTKFHVGDDTKSLAYFTKWMRQLTMSGQYRDRAFQLTGGRWVSPLTVALELRDQEWLDDLSAARVSLPIHEFARLNPKSDERWKGVLCVAADWNLALLNQFCRQLDVQDAKETKLARQRWLNGLYWMHLYSTLTGKEKEVIACATEIVLSIGARVDEMNINQLLVRAVKFNVIPLARLLVKWAGDLNYTASTYGTSLHCAVDGSHWDLLKVIVDAGGDLHKSATINLLDYSRDPPRWSFTGTPVELAARLGRLEELNSALGRKQKLKVPAPLGGNHNPKPQPLAGQHSQESKSLEPKKARMARILKVFGR